MFRCGCIIMLIFCVTGSNLVTNFQHQMLICWEITYLGYICKLREFSFTHELYGKCSSTYKGSLKGETGAKCKKTSILVGVEVTQNWISRSAKLGPEFGCVFQHFVAAFLGARRVQIGARIRAVGKK